MTFEIGKTYTVTKADGTVLTFKFLGAIPLKSNLTAKSMIFYNS